MSTMASMMRALTSVAPQENSTRTSTPRAAKNSRVVRTNSVATTPPASCSISVIPLSAGTASTQRAGRSVARLYCNSATSTTSAPVSRTQSWPVMPQSTTPSST